MHIAVGYGPVLWGVDYGHDIWFKQLGDVQIADEYTEEFWNQVEGHLVQLDVGRDGHVWGVNSDNKVYYREGISADKKEGTDWNHIDDMDMKWVAICADGQVWAVDAENSNVYFRTVVTDDNPLGEDWE